jgi:hypothetical protein
MWVIQIAPDVPAGQDADQGGNIGNPDELSPDGVALVMGIT